MTQPAPGDASHDAPLHMDVRTPQRLAQRFRPVLLRYFNRHLGSPEDAEDLTQDALARLTQQPAHRLAALVNAEAFLMRIAANLLRDRFRRDRSHHVADHVALEGTPLGWRGEEVSSERVYEDRARLQAFLHALDGLSPRCRKVFLLQRYDGLTYSAIAKQLGISVSAVEKHMMRALMHLDATLGEA